MLSIINVLFPGIAIKSLYNEFIINILNDINTLLCPSKSNSKRIELKMHTSCYWGLRLTLCYYLDYFNLFEVFGKDFGLLQNVQLMIFSSRLNEQIEMRFVHFLGKVLKNGEKCFYVFVFCGTFHNIFKLGTPYLFLHRYQWKKLPKPL